MIDPMGAKVEEVMLLSRGDSELTLVWWLGGEE